MSARLALEYALISVKRWSRTTAKEGSGGVFIKESEEFAHGLNERIRADAFYDALTYGSVLIKSLAGG